jgi:hypothetical protein
VRRTSHGPAIALAGLALVLAAACGGGAATPTPANGITRATPPAGAAAASASATVDPVYGAWARQVCAATTDFDDRVRAVQDTVDPSTLGVAARIDRATARYQAYIAGLDRIAPVLSQILVPIDARPYQDALTAQVTELRRLFTEELQALPTAKTAADIDAMTADLQRSADNLAQAVAQALAALPPAARAALAATAPCGQLIG